MKAVQYTFRTFSKILKNNNYKLIRQTGDHTIWCNGNNHITINVKPNMMVCRRLIKENNLVV